MCELDAYHEAGHALVAVLLGGHIQSITIDPDRDDGPQRFADITIEWNTSEMSARELRERIVLVALAGPVAEMIHRGEPLHPGFVGEWASDWKAAWSAAAPLVPDDRKRLAFLEKSTRTLHGMLSRDDNWAALAAIVDNLLAHETLSADEVIEIVEQWLP